MKEENEEKNIEIGEVISNAEMFIEKNKKTIILIVAAILVVVLAIFGVSKLYLQPRQNQAAEEMFAAEQWFAEGAYEKALAGDENFMGLEAIIDEYGSTKAGNLAKYYAGICYINTGKYEEAISSLKSYSGKDTFTGAEALMLIGDCYAEMQNYSDAASYYQKAAKESDNFVTAPTALWKAGMMKLAMGDNKAAAELFGQIKTKYPESSEWRDIDKYISYAENK